MSSDMCEGCKEVKTCKHNKEAKKRYKQTYTELCYLRQEIIDTLIKEKGCC